MPVGPVRHWWRMHPRLGLALRTSIAGGLAWLAAELFPGQEAQCVPGCSPARWVITGPAPGRGRGQDRCRGPRRPACNRGVIFHTDPGSTYTAKEFSLLCKEKLGIGQSMGRVRHGVLARHGTVQDRESTGAASIENPHAAFQRTSNLTASAASRSDNRCRECHTITDAATSAGSDGRSVVGATHRVGVAVGGGGDTGVPLDGPLSMVVFTRQSCRSVRNRRSIGWSRRTMSSSCCRSTSVAA